MTRTFVAAAALFSVVTAHAQNLPAPKPPGQLPPPPPGRVDAGGVLFKKIGCYQCHGGEAQGGLSGPRIGPGFPYDRFFGYTRKPTGDMPPYSTKVLTNQELADIYAWVNARPRPPAVSSLPQLAP
jgi:mono/diheme cytochrome c family protein